ncbi:uncharacterized protein RJT20DRAFT_62516 [Scheffersomyces xylosifermentans]|uniref:uncharacterized protein n=1 Tax=Scheffersomyces xylosifermentans TaxID=1304137 RepID=UPI00315C8B96
MNSFRFPHLVNRFEAESLERPDTNHSMSAVPPCFSNAISNPLIIQPPSLDIGEPVMQHIPSEIPRKRWRDSFSMKRLAKSLSNIHCLHHRKQGGRYDQVKQLILGGNGHRCYTIYDNSCSPNHSRINNAATRLLSPVPSLSAASRNRIRQERQAELGPRNRRENITRAHQLRRSRRIVRQLRLDQLRLSHVRSRIQQSEFPFWLTVAKIILIALVSATHQYQRREDQDHHRFVRGRNSNMNYDHIDVEWALEYVRSAIFDRVNEVYFRLYWGYLEPRSNMVKFVTTYRTL